jgi:hypothetical protein
MNWWGFGRTTGTWRGLVAAVLEIALEWLETITKKPDAWHLVPRPIFEPLILRLVWTLVSGTARTGDSGFHMNQFRACSYICTFPYIFSGNLGKESCCRYHIHLKYTVPWGNRFPWHFLICLPNYAVSRPRGPLILFVISTTNPGATCWFLRRPLGY